MKRVRIVITIVLAQIILCFSATAQKQFKVLLVSITNGWRHESVHAGVLAIQQLGIKIFLM